MTKKNNWLIYLGADQPQLGLEKASVVWGLTVASDYLPDITRQPYNEVNQLSDAYFYITDRLSLDPISGREITPCL